MKFWQSSERISRWIQQVSSFAAILCIIDCTVLPFLLVLISIFEGGTSTLNQPDADDSGLSRTKHLLHLASQYITFYFIVPVGGFSTVFGYVQHRLKWILFLGLIGISSLVLSHIITIQYLHLLLTMVGAVALISSNCFSQKAIHGGSSCHCHHSRPHDIIHVHGAKAADAEEDELLQLKDDSGGGGDDTTSELVIKEIGKPLKSRQKITGEAFEVSMLHDQEEDLSQQDEDHSDTPQLDIEL